MSLEANINISILLQVVNLQPNSQRLLFWSVFLIMLEI